MFLTFTAFIFVLASLSIAFLDIFVYSDVDYPTAWLILSYLSVYFYLLSIVGDRPVHATLTLSSSKKYIFTVLLFVSITVQSGIVVAFLCLWLAALVKLTCEDL